ncbi:hypothetical protein AWB70_07036 [Caballeronia cordobensis]|uniref:Lipoprotein n=1 Tax=Caballeronia cordobensis TaxID=1353886 RepID=A0A158JNA8_CABCO|nr:hypothetical protein [Caballeronia cordobensis]SAL69963.1 hypothetical protein AWB70_07036 [Caballeronia cordobensis]
MTHSMKGPRMLAALAIAVALAACNSPMPKSSTGVIPQNEREPAGADVHGAQAAIKELALPPQKPLTPNPEFARFPRYVGTLGGRQIEMKLGAKTDDPSGLHGEYRFAGSPNVILVAGDRDGDTLEIEESNDGTHITGNWVGKIAADGSLSGERMDPDDSNGQPFDLRPAVAGVKLPAMPPAGAAKAPPAPPAPSLEPAPPAPPKNAVGGTSNVIIGE